MWITSDVNLPQAVLDAQSEDRLVFFVGAGASAAAPSTLPLFDALARELARKARVSFDKSNGIDYFLGALPETFETHRHARDLIDRKDSAPNSTHTALIRLASSTGGMRIVTTNFDDHLSSAAFEMGIQIPDKWFGPALPLGGDFNGLVHLHGSVLRKPQELILTDRDFGKAYLTDAWATRFLLSMFQQFTVVFVGYSHDDPIMRYLALGLPSGTPRFAFTSAQEAKESKWTRLDVEAISYPVQDNDHSSLVAALEAWDVRVRMGQTDHRARMEEIVAGGPTTTPVDQDYIVSRINTVEGAREFARAVSAVGAGLQVAWLRWAESLPEIKALFEGKAEDAASRILATWFCHTFIVSPDLHGAALQTVQRLGQSLGNHFFHTACWAANELWARDEEAGRRWKAFLASSVQGHSAPVLTETLLAHLPGAHAEDVAVLRAALRPSLKLKRRWTFDSPSEPTIIPDAEVHLSTDPESLTAHIQHSVQGRTPGDLVLGTILEDTLSTAYDLLNAFSGESVWDALSFRRTAIEPHEQDQFPEPIDAVIDGLRIYGEKALPYRTELIERWWALGKTLFRRLALHLLTIDQSRTSDEKIAWLLDQSILYESDLKHESYRVLEATTAEASHETHHRLLQAAQAGPSIPGDEPERDQHVAYATYNLLVWLNRVAPRWPEADAALAAIKSANPEFEPREHPDVNNWMTSGTWGGKLPVEPEDFARSFDAKPIATFDDVLARDYSVRTLGEPTWEDALSMIRQVVESRPDIGEQLCRLVDERTSLGSKAVALTQAIIEGWGRADLEGVAESVLARVALQVSNLENARSVSRFLLEQIRSQVESDETPTHAAMRKIAGDLWERQVHLFTHSEDADLTSFAPLYLNSWPGDLAQFWLGELDRRWRKQRDNWSGLNHLERQALTQLLDGPAQALDAIVPALARELYFLFAADPLFTTEHLIPLFKQDKLGPLAWSSYLHHPRINDKMLASGMLDSVVAAWSQLEMLGNNSLRNQFFGLVASIASFAGITPEERQNLLDQSVLASDGAHASAFAATVVRFLQGEKIVGSAIWKLWLRDHVTSRLNGLPRTALAKEVRNWADIVPFLGPDIREASKLFSDRHVALNHRYYSPEFFKGLSPEHGSDVISYFSERMRNTPSDNGVLAHQIRMLVVALRAKFGDAAVQPLLEVAKESGLLGDSAN